MIDTRIQGIPCTVVVERYDIEDFCFTVCDRRGRPAPWLEKKMTPKDIEKVERDIFKALEGRRE